MGKSTAAKDYLFISYSSAQADMVEAMEAYLQEHYPEIGTWMAPRDIPAGGNHMQEVPRAIAGCRAFVLLITKESQQSHWVCSELSTAVEKGREIIPLNLDGCALNEAFSFALKNVQVRPMKRGIGELCDAFMQQSLGHATLEDDLARSLEELLSAAAAPVQECVPAKTGGTKTTWIRARLRTNGFTDSLQKEVEKRIHAAEDPRAQAAYFSKEYVEYANEKYQKYNKHRETYFDSQKALDNWLYIVRRAVALNPHPEIKAAYQQNLQLRKKRKLMKENLPGLLGLHLSFPLVYMFLAMLLGIVGQYLGEDAYMVSLFWLLGYLTLRMILVIAAVCSSFLPQWRVQRFERTGSLTGYAGITYRVCNGWRGFVKQWRPLLEKRR